MNKLALILPDSLSATCASSGTKKIIQRLRLFLATAVVICGVGALQNPAHSGAAVINLGDDFYVIPVFDRYIGTSDLTLTIPWLIEITRELERLLTIDIFKNGSVRVIGEENTVPGNLSGTTVTATFAVSAVNEETDVSCDGFLVLTGNISGNAISGTVIEEEDSLTCSGGLLGTEPITSTVDGTFTVTK